MRVSRDGGATWIYDTKTDTAALPNGWRFDGATRYIMWDQAPSADLITYDNFSVTLFPTKTWNGSGGDNNWNTAANWGGIAPSDGDSLVFNGTTRAGNTDNLALTVPTITFNNGGFAVGGSSALTVSSAITNVAGDNTINNAVTLGGNMLFQSAAGTLTFGGNIAGSGKNLTIAGAGGTTISGAITTGSGTVTKTNAGTLILGGVNTYTGATIVSQGLLAVNGSLASGSAVTVASGGTLGGTGVVSGAVSLSGKISPGAGPGAILTGAETWNAGGTYFWEINDTTNDVINAGGLAISSTSASKFTIGMNALGTLTGWNTNIATNWTILHTTGGISGFTNANQFNVTNNFAATGNALANSNYFNVTTVGNDLVLNYNLLSAVGDSLTRNSGSAAQFSAASLIANDVGTGLSVTAVSTTSANGGEIELGGGIIYYNPPTNNVSIASDTFTYTVTDTNGFTAVATVTITTTGTAQVRILGMQTAGLIQFNAIPNTDYKIEYTGDLTEPVTWTNLTTVTSATNGSISYQDPEDPLPPTRYYRVVVP